MRDSTDSAAHRTDYFHGGGADAVWHRLSRQPLAGGRIVAGKSGDACATANGKSWRNLRGAAGFGEQDLRQVRLAPKCYAAFVELHIEQGPLLEREQYSHWRGRKNRRAEHVAGAIDRRGRPCGRDADAGAARRLLAGAEIALAVEQAASTSGSPDTVGTTGVFRIEPGAVNSVPCAAWLEIDLRDTQLATRDAALKRIEKSVAKFASGVE